MQGYRDGYLTAQEVAGIFHVGPKTVARWAKQGKLPFMRTLGGHRRYPADRIDLGVVAPPQAGSSRLKQTTTAIDGVCQHEHAVVLPWGTAVVGVGLGGVTARRNCDWESCRDTGAGS